MEIIYQTGLNTSPTITPTAGNFAGNVSDTFTLRPLTLDQIIELENIYNGGSPFPTSLRELLFLAGQRCYVLDYGLNKSQKEMQEEARDWVTTFGFTLARPFYVIDVYSGGDNFLFVYLDEGVDDPIVNVANLDSDASSWLLVTNCTLSAHINDRITALKSGFNPF